MKNKIKTPDRFIVVDDDLTTTIICENVLLNFSTEIPVQIFLNPDEALDAIKNEYHENGSTLSTVLFLDINMPAMTGWEFLEIFKNFNTDIHKQFTTYILSSSIDRNDIERAEADTFVSGFMSKPLRKVSIEELFEDVT
jgi:CheY-like chemotaxis protein